MSEIVATFRVVTPMFLGGADPSQEAEFRLPSIKGALRFWWRASKRGTVEELRREEEQLFGASDREAGQSKLLLSLEMVTRLNILKKGEILGRDGQRSNHNNDVVGQGARYLGYGLMETIGGRLVRPCIAAPLQFSLKLRFKAKVTDSQREEALVALKLFGLCGGLGSRSRRGYGSVTLTSLRTGKTSIWSAPVVPEGWESEIQLLFSRRDLAPSMPEWTSFSRLSKVLIVSADSLSSLQLLAKLGRDFMFFRSWGRNGKVLGLDSEKRFKDDHDLMKQPAASRRNHPRRIVFGLPHNYGKREDQQVGPHDNMFERRASPLFFHIHQPSDKSPPLGVLLFLPSRFLPKGRDNISAGGRAVPLAHGGKDEFWNPVLEFMDRIQSGSGKEQFGSARVITL